MVECRAIHPSKKRHPGAKKKRRKKIINRLPYFLSNLFLEQFILAGAGIKDLPGACLVFLRDEATGGNPTCEIKQNETQEAELRNCWASISPSTSQIQNEAEPSIKAWAEH